MSKCLYSSGVCVSHEDFEEFLTSNCVKYFDEAQQSNYWMCCICNKTSRDKYDTKKHIESMHTNLPPLLCQICNKSYKTREGLRKHELEKHRSQSSTQDFVIWKQSSEFFILFWHLIIRAYHILSGNAVELTQEDLEDFLSGNNTRQPNGLWMCNICGKSSSNRIDINRHVEAQHVKLPPLHCEICDKYYKTRDSFRRHETREHRVRVDV